MAYFLTNPNDPSNRNRQVLLLLQNTRTLLNIHPTILQHELDCSKHFLFLAADKVRTKQFFATIQINLICILKHRTHFSKINCQLDGSHSKPNLPPRKRAIILFREDRKIKSPRPHPNCRNFSLCEDSSKPPS